MKRTLLALAIVAFGCSLLSCGSSSSTSPTPTPTPTPAPSLAGTVTDAVSGAAVSGVAVAAQGQSATTGSDGKYSLTGLTAGAASLTAQHQGHVNFSQSVTLASGTNTSNVALTPSNAAKMAGNWTGSWRNTTFGSTGTITMSVTTDTVQQTMQIRLDVNGNVFGGSDPPAETFNGPYTTTGATLTRTSTVYGDVTVTVTPTGQITGSAVNVPVGTISRLDFTGTATATTITINYTVTFVGGAKAIGTATLTK